MNLGIYQKGRKVNISAVTHKFETGNKIDSSVTGWILKVGDDPVNKQSITFNKFNDETGLYVSEIETDNLTYTNYMVVINAVIDTKEVVNTKYFEVIKGYAKYGIDRYNKSIYL